jgi:hypothetical protein
MTQPKTKEEYLERFHANERVSGHGIAEVRIHAPCPFCAAPDWSEWLIIECEQAMQKVTTCKECGRSGKFVFSVNTPGNKQFEFVQTGGDDPPEWLQPPPRRI